ncbi:hypothetical protein KW799_00480, partial [Candidatus Parcubacteria bacterium]|nr:hypothetical protein [Candidatus Parcubacteria bacterium]
MHPIRRTFLISALAIAPLFLPAFVMAASNPIDDFCASPTAQGDQQAMKECADLQALQDSNSKIKGEKDSIEKEISDIDGQIKIAQQNIKLQNIIIDKLSKDIGAKTTTVAKLQAKIDRETKSMSAIVAKLNDRDAISLPEIMVGSKRFSDFYTEIDQYNSLNKELLALVLDVKSSKQHPLFS